MQLLTAVPQIFFDPSTVGISISELVEKAGQLPQPVILGGSRLVVHIQTSDAAVDDLLKLVRTLAEEKKAAGFVHEESSNGSAVQGIYDKVAKKQ